MNNLFITFCSFFSILAMLHGFSRGTSPVFLFAVTEVALLTLIFSFYRKQSVKIWLVLTVILCGISFLFYGFMFSREFTITSKMAQITLALSMNANLVLGAVVGIFGLKEKEPDAENAGDPT